LGEIAVRGADECLDVLRDHPSEMRVRDERIPLCSLVVYAGQQDGPAVPSSRIFDELSEKSERYFGSLPRSIFKVLQPELIWRGEERFN
jgi:hypothetical protein